MASFFNESVKINQKIKEIEQDNLFIRLFAKLIHFLNDENVEFFKKEFSTIKIYQIIYHTPDGKINFDYMSSANKKIFIVKLICEATNFHPNMTTCDWSTSTMPLHGCGNIIISFLNHIEFDIVCTQLTGYKSVNEVLDIIFNLYTFFFFEKMHQIFQTKFLEQEFKEFYQVIIRI